MTRKLKVPTYPRELGKRIRSNFPSRLHFVNSRDFERDQLRYQEAMDSERSRISELTRVKLPLLAKQYGRVWPEEAAELVQDLAQVYVRGFQVVERPAKLGRKKTWPHQRLLELSRTVGLVKSLHNFTDQQACKFISTNLGYKSDWGPPAGHTGGLKAWWETLESRLHDARRAQRQEEQFLKAQ